MNNREVSLYIHLPYCQRKCKYCDFVSFVNKESTFERYTDTLLRELRQYKDDGLFIKTIFIGGGTPSLVPCDMIGSLLEYVFDEFYVDDNAEITIECNPCSADAEKLKAYKKYGVNRISIGVQSFDNELLKTLGRLHDSVTAEKCIRNAKAVGFDNISIDLMFSIPGQTLQALESSIENAVNLGIEHISLYSLILEDGTPITKMVENGLLDAIDDTTDRLMYKQACRKLAQCGYNQYEISNFAKNGRESLHNCAYWTRNEYIGIGCAAHSCYNGERYSNILDIDEYMRSQSIGKKAVARDKLTVTDIAEETVMLGLRMNKGFSMQKLYEETGINLKEKSRKTIARLVKYGLIECNDDVLKLTDSGRDVLNSIVVELISDL